MSKLVKESLFDDIARYKVVDTVSGEVIDDDMPKHLAQKLAAKKKEWSVGLDSKNARSVKEDLNEGFNKLRILKNFMSREMDKLEQQMEEAEGNDIETFLKLESKLEVYVKIMDMLGWDL